MTKSIKIVSVTVLLTGATACMQTNGGMERPSPTHRWTTDQEITRTEYNFDHQRCIEQSNVSVDGAVKTDDAFVAYEQCMEGKGYILATY